MRLIIPFPGGDLARVDEVGGKGDSLIRMLQAGLPVPPGVVLTTKFFEPWFDEVKASATWRALANASSDQWTTLCAELKGLCRGLAVTDAQRQALKELGESFAAMGGEARFAVRSSSPEEDLAAASFAGGYETRLNVRPDQLERSIRGCFASSFDERVLVYKRQHGLDVLAPRIAVVVQQQVASDVAGVAFSLNPVTNDYDEVAIDACWGLGEAVVAGLTTPDHFVVDKVSRRVVETRLGAKQVSRWTAPGGGTIDRACHRSAETTLGDDQLRELAEMVCQIERLDERPVDVEWAYAARRFWVLQARPITRYVPLAPKMTTRPGARRLLYADAALSKGMTLNAPISPLGLSWFEDFMLSLVRGLQPDGPPARQLIFAAGSRMYMNVSLVMRLVSVKRFARLTSISDAVLGGIMASIDERRYRAPMSAWWMLFRMVAYAPRALWLYRWMLWSIPRALLSPERAWRAYRQEVDAYEKDLTENVDYERPLEQFRRAYGERMQRSLFKVTMPAILTGVIPIGFLIRKRSAEDRELVEKLEMGFPGNVVVEMGIALYRLARVLPPSDFEDTPRLAERIAAREMPAGFLSAWDAFVARYGCRGPLEMDVASPRYADDPGLALRQMSFMAGGNGFDPGAAQARHVEERRQACAMLLARSGWLRRSLLRRIHNVRELFGGTRDTPKHHVVLFLHALRKRALVEGRRLVEEGRLDRTEDIFMLGFEDLRNAATDPSLDLRRMAAENARQWNELRARVTEFPVVVDSRGRILRAPRREERPGEAVGVAVSPGVAAGRIKILRNPHEKRVERGDVLVAYTTDPGWTPLFVSAAAVLLEVGGMLQHGAVIAREYGKPCVVGIADLMTRFRDGQTVEVDGNTGVVRLLS